MATVKFHFVKDNSNIKLTFHYGTGNRIRCSTKLPSPTDFKSIKKDLLVTPSASAGAINTATKLRGLRDEILNCYTTADTEAIEINTAWLQEIIRKHFKRESPEQKNFNVVRNYLETYISQKEKKRSVDKSTIQKFRYLRTRILEFEKLYGEITFTNLNPDKVEMFTDWLQEEYGLMISTTNRIRKNLRTIVLDATSIAYKFGMEIPNEARQISMEKETDTQDKIYLSFDELKLIKNATFIGNELQIARDWLIIGCYTGQRVSDLLRMTNKLISTKYTKTGAPYQCIELVQKKTRNTELREIAIPIHPEVQNILQKYDNNFPPLYSCNASSNEAMFNRYLKKVCEIAGIHTMVRAKVRTQYTVEGDTKTKNTIQSIEKCYVISSHACRRSFATNFYGDKRFTTPQLIAITGHKTEHMFLQYIAKQSIDHASETATVFQKMTAEVI